MYKSHIPGYSGVSVLIIDSGIQYTISKSYITSMAPACVSSMFLHTSRSKYENILVLIEWFTMALCHIGLACRDECMPRNHEGTSVYLGR